MLLVCFQSFFFPITNAQLALTPTPVVLEAIGHFSGSYILGNVKLLAQ